MLGLFLASLIVGLVCVGCLAWIARELKGPAERIKRANPRTSAVGGQIKKMYRRGNFHYVRVGLYAVDKNNVHHNAGSTTVKCEREFGDDVEVGKTFLIA